jgi:CRP-like cAMP-binding protein
MSYRSDPRIRGYRSLELFQGCSRRQLRTVARLGTRLNAPTGRTLARQGTRRREFILVIEGAVDVLRDGQVVDHLGPADHCGEFTLLRSVPQPATVVAAAPSIVDVFEGRDFLSIYNEMPSFRAVIDRTLSQRTAAWLTVPTTATAVSPALTSRSR